MDWPLFWETKDQKPVFSTGLTQNSMVPLPLGLVADVVALTVEEEPLNLSPVPISPTALAGELTSEPVMALAVESAAAPLAKCQTN